MRWLEGISRDKSWTQGQEREVGLGHGCKPSREPSLGAFTPPPEHPIQPKSMRRNRHGPRGCKGL